MSRARDLGSSINSTVAGKNLLINGAFDIWQRGTSVTFLSGNVYLADRWCGGQRFQQSRQQRVSLGYQNTELNSQYAMRVSTSTVAKSSGGTRMRLSQTVESLNTYQARGKQVTLSFWVRFSAATIPSVSNSGESLYGNWNAWITYYTTTTDAVQNTVGEDSDSGVININTGSLPTSWTKYTITGTVPNNANNIGVAMAFAGRGSTASADQHWYEVAQVQLEVGSSATQFSRAGGDIQGELAKCQRYYEKSYNYDIVIQSNTTQGITQITDQGVSANATNGVEVNYKVAKRVTPTIATYRRDGSATNPNYWQCYAGTSGPYFPVLVDLGSKSHRSFLPYFTSASGLSLNGAHAVNGHWTADAEL